MKAQSRICIFAAAIAFVLLTPNLMSVIHSTDGYQRKNEIGIPQGKPTEDDPGDIERTTSSRLGQRSDGLNEVGTVERTVELGPGERYYAYLDSENQVLVEMDITDDSEDLPQEAKDAVNAAPGWLRDDLRYTFTTLTVSEARTYANHILNAKDNRYVDEIAFSIAHSHSGLLRWMVQNGQHGLFSDNAEAIYAMDGKGLNYAELVEKGDHTTIRYKSVFGGEKELERDIYYWEVVYPRGHIDRPSYHSIDGQSRFWRAFFPDDVRYPGQNGKSLFVAVKDATSVYNAAEKLGSWLLGFMEFAYGGNYIHPLDIYQNPTHCSCGQYTIITAILAKTMFIPTSSLGAMAEDHVWNELYDTKWIHWDTSIGDINANEINIIDAAGLYDPDQPGSSYGNGALGKEVSAVYAIKGDESIYQSLQYTPYGTMNIQVTDKDGKPVDGSKIFVHASAKGTTQVRRSSIWGYTDSRGIASFEIGNNLDYWIMAIHPVLGEYPGDGKVGRVVQNAQPGGVYDVPIQYIEGASLELKATELPQSGSGTVRIESVFEVESERQWCENEDTKGWNMGTKYPYDTEGQSITSFICDSDNFEKYLEGKDFDVFELLERSPEGNLVFESDRQRDWYVVITNELSYGVTKEINVSISMFYSGRPVVDITDPVIGSLHAGDVDITVNGRVFCTESIASLEYRVDSDQWIDILFSYDEATGSFSFSWDPGVLSTGEHTLDFRAEDTNSEQGSRQLTIVIDASPPELGLTEPLNRTVYDLGDEVALSGTVDDDLGNVLLFLEVHSEEKRSGDIIISENISHLVSQGSFEYSIETDDLDAGEYNAVISAFDDVGHVTISRISFFIDEEGPQIIITSHGNGDLVGGRDLILITGTAVDDVGFSTLEMEISDLGSNDILPRLNGTGWDYEWNVSDLESDIYQIVVTGYDGVDRWSQASMTLELDADAPELEILNENGSVVSDDKIVEIIGTAYDDNDVETLEIAVIPATEEHDPATVVMKEPDLAWESLMKKYSRSEWKYEWDTTGLEAGDHLIIVRAIDQVGNTRLSAMNMKIDNEVPVITMEMDHDVETEPLVTGMVEFKGTALDNDLVETLELTWNRGKTWTSLLSEYDGMNWTYHWDVDTLESGEYRIEIRAVDRAGKQFVLKSDFTVDNDDPELKINSRTVSEYTVGDSVVFSGTVYDEYGLDSMVFRIDQGDWRSTVLDNDTGKWHFQWSTEDEAPGRHTITLLVRDKVGHDTSDTLTLTLKEREKEGTGGSVLGSESWYPWILISAAVLVVLGVALILIIMKRKRKKERDDELPTLTADENGDVLHIPLQGFTPTEIQSLEKGPERNDPGTNYSKNYYEARGHESTGIGDREQVPAELGSAAGPDCMKCGRPSKYYTEHDCYWCEGCRDYVRREEPVESSQEDNELESLAPPDKLPVTTVNVKKEQRLMLPAAKVDEETRAGTMEDDMTSARRDRPSGTASDKIQPEITDSNTGNPKMEMNALKSDVGEGGQLAVRTVKPRRVVKRRKTIKN